MQRPHQDGCGFFRESIIRPATLIGAALFGSILILVAPTVVRAQCDIQGVSTVDEGQSFTLCGPRGTNYSYRWAGPGAPGTRARCITIPGRSSGMYEYTLAIDVNGIERDRCTFVVTVEGEGGSASSGPDVCDIVGPSEFERGTTVELCGVPSRNDTRTYYWTGPGGFRSSTRCIRVSRAGTYSLVTRNEVNGRERHCTHRLVEAATPTDEGDCIIRGPEVIREGERVRLCGPSTSAFTFRWTGPGGYLSTSSCVNVAQPGTYTLTLRHRATGEVLQCRHTIDEEYQGPDDSEQPDYENCPRDATWWSRVLIRRGELTPAELRSIAQCVDERARSFDWANDVDGLSRALTPAAPVTRRARAAQQLAALLANICARERGVTAANGQVVGLDADTPISLRSANTVGELAALLDRMLARRTGNFASVNRIAAGILRGQGIGPTCP